MTEQEWLIGTGGIIEGWRGITGDNQSGINDEWLIGDGGSSI